MDNVQKAGVAVIGVVALGFAFNQVVKHMPDKPAAPTRSAETHESTPLASPSLPVSTPVVEEEPAQPPGPTQEELDEQLIRSIYDLRTKAAGACKVTGISDAGLSAQLAVSLIQNESGRMKRELDAHDIAQLEGDNFALGNAMVGDKDLWTFLQENKIIPLVEYTNDPTLGAAFVNTGGQKALVFYASQEKSENGVTGTSFNINGNADMLLEALAEDGALKAGSILLYLDDSRLGDGDWKIHTFKSGEKSFEMIEGVKQTLMVAPRNPCGPAAP
jgi:hypothetical protein